MKAWIGLVKVLFGLIAVPFVLIGILVLGVLGTLAYKTYWDWRVEMMCARDGGRTVYEKVFLPPDDFKTLLDEHGDIDLNFLEYAEANDKYAVDFHSKLLHRGKLGLEIRRSTFQIYRLKDQKRLAEQTTFSRIGGDFPFSSSAGSAFRCPKFKNVHWYNSIFFVSQ